MTGCAAPAGRAATRRLWLAQGCQGVLGVAAVRGGFGLGLGLLGSGPAVAGAQLEEPLANAVRTALSAAIASSAPPRPSFGSAAERQVFERWRNACSDRLKRRLAEAHTRTDLLDTLWYEAKRAGLEPSLVLGLVQVESAFRKYAISSVGARGYMQVMPFWARLIGDGDVSRLFHTQTNLRFGCVILRHYLDIERGNLFMALGRYNGSRGRAKYPDAVFAARQAWPEASAGQA